MTTSGPMARDPRQRFEYCIWDQGASEKDRSGSLKNRSLRTEIASHKEHAVVEAILDPQRPCAAVPFFFLADFWHDDHSTCAQRFHDGGAG